MDKRKKRTEWTKALLGAAAVTGALILTIAVLAMLIGNGAVKMEAQRTGLILCCLVSGTIGALYSGKGEGKGGRLLVGFVPAMLLLLIAAAAAKRMGSVRNAAIYSACLMVPSAAATLYKGGRRRKSGRRKRPGVSRRRR